MILPRNGSPAANVLLVAGGMVLGAILSGIIVTGPRKAGQTGLSGERSPRTDATSRPENEPSLRNALASAEQEKSRLARNRAFREAGIAGARSNLRSALDAGQGIVSGQDKLAYQLGLMGEWAESDPQAALDHARTSTEPGLLQSESIGIAINKWAEKNPHDAWLWAQGNLTGPLKERALTDLMVGWTRRDPREAAAWLSSTGLTSQPLYNALARTYAEQFPREAYDWASNLPPGVAKDTAEVAAAGEWARQDPLAAADAVASSLAGDNGSNLAISITDIWGTTNPAQTAEWITGLPAGDARNVAAGALATIWGASDIESAVAWSGQIEDPSMRRQTISHLGTTWGAIEPDRALDWLSTLPPEDARDGISGAFSSWAATDPVGLVDWIEQSQNDPLADQGRLRLGEVYTATNMEAAMDLALQMSTDAGRDQTAGRFFREWRRTDDASAQEWIQSTWNTLPPGVQTRLTTEQALPIIPR